MNVLSQGRYYLISRKFLVLIVSFFVLFLLNYPIYADLLKSFKPGEIFRLPGSELSSVLIDQDGDGTVDGIDFDHDQVPELRFVNINYKRAVGIDDNQDNKPDFYIVQTREGRLIIAHTLETKEIRRLLGDHDNEVSLKKVVLWSDMSISMIGGYGISLGTFSDKFPNAFGGALYVDQGLDRILSVMTGLRRHLWFPGLRIAGGYSIYTNQPTRVSWISLQMGPLWRIPIHPEHSGYFAISLLFGAAHLNVRTARGVREGFAFSSDLTLSYEYRLEEDVHFIFQPSGRYIRSSEAIFIQFNVSVGVGYNIRL